jgi:hypothetical protein
VKEPEVAEFADVAEFAEIEVSQHNSEVKEMQRTFISIAENLSEVQVMSNCPSKESIEPKRVVKHKSKRKFRLSSRSRKTTTSLPQPDMLLSASLPFDEPLQRFRHRPIKEFHYVQDYLQPPSRDHFEGGYLSDSTSVEGRDEETS